MTKPCPDAVDAFEMTDPKAPLPDEVAAALDFLHSYAQFNHRALIHRDTLRAHISAQAEKIAELEAKVGHLDAEIVGHYQTLMQIDAYVDRFYTATATNAMSRDSNRAIKNQLKGIIEAALAQTEQPFGNTGQLPSNTAQLQQNTDQLPPALCKTCGGSKTVKSDTAPCHIDCPTCNGTGREVK